MTKIRTGAAMLLGAVSLSVIGALEPAAALARADSSAASIGNQDSVFVTLCESNGIYNADGPATEAKVGRAIANDLVHGVSPVIERNRVYNITNNTISLTDANVMVNAAGVAYLGWVLTPNGRLA